MEFFKEWLKFCFDANMTFENYGELWHIDHTSACAKFDLSQVAEQKKCFHWSNLKPLVGKENLAKHVNTTLGEVKKHEAALGAFIGENWFTWEGEFTLIEIDHTSYM